MDQKDSFASETPTAVILAAGKGTRMKSDLPKVATLLAGRPLLLHVIDSLRLAGVRRMIPVIGFQRELVKGLVPATGDLQFEFAIQEEQKGTAHALLCAEPHLNRYTGTILVACGDMPLIRPESFRKLIREHIKHNSYATVLSAELKEPKGYGRIVRDSNGSLLSIIEEKDATDDIRKITEVNTGTYLFKAPDIFRALSMVGSANAQKEYYLPDVISIFRSEGASVHACKLDHADESLGCNSVDDLQVLELKLKERS